MPKYAKNDLTGQTFERLSVLWFLPDSSKHSKFWCRCSCGIEKSVMAQALIGGFVKSCGCLQKESAAARKLTHGHSGKGRTKTYNSWAGMMDRCHWGGHKVSYSRYGAKGIKVDESWHSFENFYADMGNRPPKTSIDRIDNKKGYSKENCRWATRLEQALNRSTTLFVIYQGKKTPVYLLCQSLSLPAKALRARASRRGGDYVLALASFGVFVEPVYKS
jgi:hypothetical protein